jgi:hypothetical protein
MRYVITNNSRKKQWNYKYVHTLNLFIYTKFYEDFSL